MIVSRFAPSPSGRLHLGHAYSAVIGHQWASTSGGEFRLRIEDLDQTRCRPALVKVTSGDLRLKELGWREAWQVPSPPLAATVATLDLLEARWLASACFCTRADIAQSATARCRRGCRSRRKR